MIGEIQAYCFCGYVWSVSFLINKNLADPILASEMIVIFDARESFFGLYSFQ